MSAIGKILLAGLILALTACGFQLRGVATLPFHTLYVDAGGQIAGDIKLALHYGSNVKVVDNRAEAEAVLQLSDEGREQRILSVNAAGRVSEYLLLYHFSFRVHDGKGRDLLAAQRIELRRDLPYSDAQVLPKAQEAELLFRDMQTDAVQQVMRRLAALKA